MKFGLEDRHWQTIEKLLLAPLKSRHAQIWIFGSRARGTNQPFSDLDVLYSAKVPIPLAEIGQIQESLENSNLPIKVDLVSLADLAESYRDSALKDRVAI